MEKNNCSTNLNFQKVAQTSKIMNHPETILRNESYIITSFNIYKYQRQLLQQKLNLLLNRTLRLLVRFSAIILENSGRMPRLPHITIHIMNKHITTAIFFFGFASGSIFAQQGIHSSGGNASGAGGS